MNKYNCIEDIYAKIPRITCKKKCSESCGPIKMSDIEQQVIDNLYGKSDFSLDGHIERKCLQCIKLVKGKCSIYMHRPLICRLWGVVKTMRCPWGCRPKRWLSDAEAHELIKAAKELKNG